MTPDEFFEKMIGLRERYWRRRGKELELKDLLVTIQDTVFYQLMQQQRFPNDISDLQRETIFGVRYVRVLDRVQQEPVKFWIGEEAVL